jgi:hypothetical protein
MLVNRQAVHRTKWQFRGLYVLGYLYPVLDCTPRLELIAVTCHFCLCHTSSLSDVSTFLNGSHRLSYPLVCLVRCRQPSRPTMTALLPILVLRGPSLCVAGLQGHMDKLKIFRHSNIITGHLSSKKSFQANLFLAGRCGRLWVNSLQQIWLQVSWGEHQKYLFLVGCKQHHIRGHFLFLIWRALLNILSLFLFLLL